MSNQDINVTGERNVIRVIGSGSLKVGNQSVDVSGTNNRVVISAGGSLHVGSLHVGSPTTTRPPTVCRGQVWQHNVLARRYQVISVRNGLARCLVTDMSGKPIRDDGKAIIQDITTINLRYAYALVSG